MELDDTITPDFSIDFSQYGFENTSKSLYAATIKKVNNAIIHNNKDTLFIMPASINNDSSHTGSENNVALFPIISTQEQIKLIHCAIESIKFLKDCMNFKAIVFSLELKEKIECISTLEESSYKEIETMILNVFEIQLEQNSKHSKLHEVKKVEFNTATTLDFFW